MGRMDDAMDKFNEMIDMGVPHDTTVYTCMIEGYLKHGDPMKAKELIAEMKNKKIRHRSQKGS
jgi:pentatricopeptide repeat protein